MSELINVIFLERETADQRDMELSRRMEFEKDLEEAQAKNAELRKALVDAAIPLEVIASEIESGTCSEELSPPLRQSIRDAALGIRAALFHKDAPDSLREGHDAKV